MAKVPLKSVVIHFYLGPDLDARVIAYVVELFLEIYQSKSSHGSLGASVNF